MVFAFVECGLSESVLLALFDELAKYGGQYRGRAFGGSAMPSSTLRHLFEMLTAQPFRAL
jgi:hypothetical protein